MAKQNRAIQQEVADEQEQYNTKPEDYKEAENLRLGDSDKDFVDSELKQQGHSKSTGFETSHAKKEFGTNQYLTNFANPLDPLVRKDPSRCYKQIDFNNFRSNGYRDSRGWIPLTKNNVTVEGFPDPRMEYGADVPVDGFWHVEDRIWAWMPRERYEQVRAMIRKKTILRTKSTTENFKKEGSDGLGRKNIEIEDETTGPG